MPSKCNSARESALFPQAAPCPFSILGRTLCRTCNGPVDQEDEHVALSNNLNFKRVIGCQVFWPLKLWFLVWHVLKTMKTKTVGFGKFVWPDNNCDIDLVERLRVVKILPKPQIKDVQDLVNLIERKKLKYKVQSNEYYT